LGQTDVPPCPLEGEEEGEAVEALEVVSLQEIHVQGREEAVPQLVERVQPEGGRE